MPWSDTALYWAPLALREQHTVDNGPIQLVLMRLCLSSGSQGLICGVELLDEYCST
jgi:hypothetical protein